MSLLRVIAALILLALCSTPLNAESVEEFYRGRTVSLVVGYPPTSGYSVYAHVLARHLPKHIPGRPTVIVRNLPGAASMNAANSLYNVSPKDGSVIGMFATAVVVDALFGETAAKFDATQFNWLANVDESVGTCIVWHSSPIKSFEDLFQTSTFFGASGPAAGITQHALALTNLFGSRIKLVRGYGGGADIILAMERGEVEGQCGVPISLLKTQLAEKLQAGLIRPIIHDKQGPAIELPGVPSVYDFVKSEDDRQVLDLVFGWHVLGRPVAAPPGVPSDRVQALRGALMATMADPEFLEDAKRTKLDVQPLEGAKVAERIAGLLTLPKNVVERAARAVREP